MDDKDAILKPVLEDEAVETLHHFKPTSFFERFTWLIRLLCGFAAIVALTSSLWFFIGFLENDTGLWHVLSAFAMSMGIGALGFIPALWMSCLARLTLVHGAKVTTALLVILLVIPWGGMGTLLLRLEGFWRVLGICLLALVTLINIWAFMVMMHSRR